jgi:glyoxylase-like metal-dependent hydrolase (beta-lactamase superfamily II)
MIFRQLFDPETATYTYLLADERTREAVLVDTVLEQLDRDSTLLRELDLELVYTLETHVHADHVTASGRLRETLGSKVGVGVRANVENADRVLADGESVEFGGCRLETRQTPGHTEGCVTFVCHAAGLALTGDALLIRGCGRTDFQQGDARTLFRSVRDRILSLPDETLLYPGHDYRGHTVTTVREENRFNPRLGLARSEAEFVEIMHGLKLAYPKRMDRAVPANLVSGLLPASARDLERDAGVRGSVADLMAGLRQDAELWGGMGI